MSPFCFLFLDFCIQCTPSFVLLQQLQLSSSLSCCLEISGVLTQLSSWFDLLAVAIIFLYCTFSVGKLLILCFYEQILKIFRPLLLGIILVTSYSRTTSLLNGYSAPMKVLSYLPSTSNHNNALHKGTYYSFIIKLLQVC